MGVPGDKNAVGGGSTAIAAEPPFPLMSNRSVRNTCANPICAVMMLVSTKAKAAMRLVVMAVLNTMVRLAGEFSVCDISGSGLGDPVVLVADGDLDVVETAVAGGTVRHIAQCVGDAELAADLVIKRDHFLDLFRKICVASGLLGDAGEVGAAKVRIGAKADKVERNAGSPDSIEGSAEGDGVGLGIVDAIVLAVGEDDHGFAAPHFADLLRRPFQCAVKVGVASCAQTDHLFGAGSYAAPLHKGVDLAVETRQSNLVLRAQVRKESVDGFADEADLRIHAAALIDDEEDVVWTVQRSERLQLLRPAVLVDFEILFTQVADGNSGGIEDGDVHRNHGHIDP
jgi:hypothetical protein